NTFPTLVADVVAVSAMKQCPLVGSAPDGAPGDGVWAEGNIFLGGGGSDIIEGRGSNDIIDGDHYLTVQINITGLPGGPASTDLMEHVPTGPGWTGALTGKTLQAAVFAGLVDPGNPVASRQLPTMGATPNTATPGDCGDLPATG